MPTIFRYGGYRFFFFSNEGDPREPCHIHVRKGAALAKFWLQPEVALADSYDISSKELASLFKLVQERKTFFVEHWNDFFST